MILQLYWVWNLLKGNFKKNLEWKLNEKPPKPVGTEEKNRKSNENILVP